MLNTGTPLPPAFRRARLWLAGFALVLATAPGYAQPPAQEDEPSGPAWYQVEVLIFANDSPYAAGPERWPENVELAYPTQIVALAPPPSAQTSRVAGMEVDDTTAVTVDNPDATAAAATPEPFVALDDDQLELTAAAARLLRQGNYRTLFHKAWRQPTAGRDNAISVLVRGGDSFDDHRELEGSIQLSVERYLHFRTDLWLSTFTSTAGLDELPWPKLPRLPVVSADQANTQPNFDALFNNSSLSGMNWGSQIPAFNLSHRRYVVDTTAVLRQSRRMRSSELHYIDHPLMGILVRATPYELPTPEPEAAETAATEAASTPSASVGE